MFVPLHDANKLKSIPFQYVTLLLIALNVAVFLVQQASGQPIGDFASFGLVPRELLQVGYFGGPAYGQFDKLAVPESYTLISYMFFHGDIFHLVFNMAFLWVFGDNVEDAMGHLKFLVFYLLCGVIAGLLHTHMSPTSPRPLIGASGAVAGVISAYLILHPRVRVWVLAFRFLPLRISAFWALGAWIVLQFVMVYMAQIGMQNGPVAWWAHIGGLVAGAVLIVFMRRPDVPLFDQGLTSADK
ncbi:MAG: rhomboid family intramembrane serine protease [Hyphomicrobiaceae bacterium]